MLLASPTPGLVSKLWISFLSEGLTDIYNLQPSYIDQINVALKKLALLLLYPSSHARLMLSRRYAGPREKSTSEWTFDKKYNEHKPKEYLKEQGNSCSQGLQNYQIFKCFENIALGTWLFEHLAFGNLLLRGNKPPSPQNPLLEKLVSLSWGSPTQKA